MDDKGTIWEKHDRDTMHHDEDVFDDEFGNPKTGPKAIIAAILVITVISMVTVVNMCTIKVDATEWVICQTALSGRVQVLDRPGLHFRPFAKTWTFKRYSTIKMDDDCMFKDGRPRKIDTYIRVQLPESTNDRIELYQKFGGEMHSIEKAVDIIVTNAIRLSASNMNSHKFDVDGKPEILRLVEASITTPLRHYGLTLSAFGIVNATVPPDEVPQGASDDELRAEIKAARESMERAKQEAIKDAEYMRDAYIKMHHSDGEN